MPTMSEFLIERLKNVGVGHVFGVPGDYILKFYESLYKSPIEVIGTTNEAAAGFAADAYARVHGVGCVCATYCVGGFNLVNAIGCAYAEKSPVIFISGSPGLKEREEEILLHHMVRNFECQHRVFENITCGSAVLRNPTTAAYEIDRVFEAVKYYKQPAYLELPRDLADRPVQYDAYTLGTPASVKSDPEILDEAVGEVVEWIKKSKRPVILAGVELARHRLGEELMKFSEATNIPVATTLLGKSVINERHSLSLGVYCGSLLSRESVSKVVESSDCFIMLGALMTDMNLGFLPLKFPKKNAVVATCEEIRIKGHTFHGVHFADFVRGFFKHNIPPKESQPISRVDSLFFEAVKGRKITASRFFEKINSVLDDGMAIIADVGDCLFGATDLTVHHSNYFLCPAFYTSMGFAVPGALGVQTALPGVRPIVLVGDGAFQMTGQEFSTIVRRGLNPIVFVLNNSGYATERLLLDGPFNDIQNWNYHKMPELVGGGEGVMVKTENELEDACNQALGSPQPYIVNVIIGSKDVSPALKRMTSKLSERVR